LGYTIKSTYIQGVTNEPDLANLILKVLTILLVLHPIAAGLALLTVLPVIASRFVFHRAPWIISLILSIATAIMSTIMFTADLALTIVATLAASTTGSEFAFLPGHCVTTSTCKEAAKKLYRTLLHNHLQRLSRVLQLHSDGSMWGIVREHLMREIPRGS
jgi:hypothetical protein